MSGNLDLTPDNLKWGVYHEIGHVIVALLRFSKRGFVNGIVFGRTSKIGCGLQVSVIPEKFDFTSDEIDSYAMFCLAGGVFQQMILYYELCKFGLHHNNDEELKSGSKSEALEKFLCGMVKAKYDGMEADYSTFEEQMRKRDYPSVVDFDEIKNKTIHLLLPYIACDEVRQLCEECVEIILLDCKCNHIPVEIDMDLIGSYLLDNFGSIIKGQLL